MTLTKPEMEILQTPKLDTAGLLSTTDILRKVWTSDSPVNFRGEFYEVRGQRSAIKCHQNPHIPIYGGGGSAAAIQSLAPRVDVFMLWGEPLAETRAFMRRVTAAGVKHDCTPTFSVSTRPILGQKFE